MDVLIGTVIYAITGLVNCLSHIRYLAICDVSLIATLEMNYIKCEAKHKLMYFKNVVFFTIVHIHSGPGVFNKLHMNDGSRVIDGVKSCTYLR